MRPFVMPSRIRAFLRGLLVGVCVVAHLAVTIGFPLPEAVAIDPKSKPFPCQHHRCGCRSAEQCWRDCCCMSMEEKLAWAEKNGVTPPDYVAAAVRKAAADRLAKSDGDRLPTSSKSCCSAPRVASSSKPCCSASPCCRQSSDKPAAAKAEIRRQIGWVIGSHALKCQGLAMHWVSCGAVLPPPAIVELPQSSAPPFWWSSCYCCKWSSVESAPDVPPPRCV